MLLLVTIGLVLAGLVLLIVGFVQDSLGYIFVSIACAAVAAIALIVFGRLSRRRSLQIALDGGTAKLPSDRLPAPARRPQVEMPAATPRSRTPEPDPLERLAAGAVAAHAASRSAPPVVVEEEEELDEEEPEWATAVAAPAAPAPAPTYRQPEPAWQPAGGTWEEDDWGDEVVFPIEDYDELRVAEIMPLLPELEPDELDEVRDRESTGKNRNTIIFRIDELLGRETVEVAPAPPVAAAPVAPSRRATAFPIADYDDLRVAEILPLLADLDAIGLERVRAHETALKDRATIVQRIDDIVGRTRIGEARGEPGGAGGRVPARLVSSPAPKPAATRAAAPKRAAAAPAKSTPAKRGAPAKAAPGRKAAAPAPAPARKAAAPAPAPTRRAPAAAGKAAPPARKAAAPTGRAAAPARTRATSPAPAKAVKKAAPSPAKKAAPARAAAAAKKTTKAAAPARQAATGGKAAPARKAAKRR